MVSADGGKSWGEAALDAPVLSKALTRFRMPWRWDGQPVVLQSRAWDEAGNVQPTRDDDVRRARRAQGQCARDRVPDGAHERHHELGHRQQRGGQACLCVKAWLLSPLSRCAFGAATAVAADRPGLGKPVTEADLALWDISVGPDGAGLPPGSGTPAQGAVVYAQKCELCHGKAGPERPQCRAGRTAAHHRHLRAARHDDLRLHAAGDAVAAAEVADQ